MAYEDLDSFSMPAPTEDRIARMHALFGGGQPLVSSMGMPNFGPHFPAPGMPQGQGGGAVGGATSGLMSGLGLASMFGRGPTLGASTTPAFAPGFSQNPYFGGDVGIGGGFVT